MKIVILDGYTTNPGDLSWQDFLSLGELTVYERTPKERIVERAAGCEIVITNKTVLGAEEINALPELKYIGLLSTGCNAVDLQAASARKIAVTNVPAYSTNSVAQLVWSYILTFANHAEHHSRLVHDGAWVSCKDFCFWDRDLIELHGKHLGIFGFGHIGRAVAQIGLAFGMNVLVYSRTMPEDLGGCSFVSKDELFCRSDFLTFHCPLTEETEGLVNRDLLKQMKPSAFLINTSRGPVVNEYDLAEALNTGLIAGAAVDVLSTEPPDADNPLLTAKNCIVTPHLAWASKEPRQRLIEIAAANVKGFIKGNIQNKVN